MTVAITYEVVQIGEPVHALELVALEAALEDVWLRVLLLLVLAEFVWPAEAAEARLLSRVRLLSRPQRLLLHRLAEGRGEVK